MNNKQIQTVLVITGFLCFLGLSYAGLSTSENQLAGLIAGALIGITVLAVLVALGNILAGIDKLNESQNETNMLLAQLIETINQYKDLR